MTEAINQHNEAEPLQKLKDLTAQWAKYFNGIQQVLDENERLQQRVAALEKENEALTDTLEQWKSNDEWSNRVTYDNVVDQIASLEDASKRDDARRMFEPLLKKTQAAQLRKDIKKRVKEMNEDSDGYNDKQVAQALEACVGKGRVIDAKWKWAGVYWYLRWTCNYPVDAKDFCQKIRSLELDIPADYECSYESIRKICTLSFMDCDARRMDIVRVSKNDQGMFSQCREIALKLAEELGNSYLPQE
jgi:hypothetical protein